MKTFLTIGDRWLATCSVALDARGGWTPAAGSRTVKTPVCLRLKRVVVRSGEKNSRYRQTPAGRRPCARHAWGSMRTGDGGGGVESQACVRRVRPGQCGDAFARQGAGGFEPQPGRAQHPVGFDQRAIPADCEPLRSNARGERNLQR